MLHFLRVASCRHPHESLLSRSLKYEGIEVTVAVKPLSSISEGTSKNK
jgi:hypothetical protein